MVVVWSHRPLLAKQLFDSFQTILYTDLRNSLVHLGSHHSFKTRTGPAGRPGTRPTRAWDRSGWRQKPGRPGQTRSTRSNPGETRLIFFILTVIKRRRFGLLKGQNADWRFKSSYFTLYFLWPLAFYPSPAASPFSPERLDGDGLNQAKAKAFVGTRDAKDRRIEGLGNEKEVLQLILIETIVNCFTFSFRLPALGAQKEGLVLLTH